MIALKDLLQDDFSLSRQAMVLGDDTGKAYATNPAAAELFGYSENEILAEGRQPIIEHDALFDLYIAERRKYGSAVGIVNCRHRSGQRFRVLISSRRIDAELDYPVYCISFYRLDDYLRQFGSKDGDSMIGETGAWELDLRKNQFLVSDTIRKIHDVTEGYVYDLDNILVFFADELAKRKVDRLARASIRKGGFWDEEFRVITGKGNLKWIKVRCYPVFQDGKCLALKGTVQDIDAFKKLEDWHRQENIELDILLSNSRKLVSIRDQDHNLLYCNEAYTAIFGYDFQECRERSLFELVCKEDQPDTEAALQRVRREKLVEDFQNRIVTKSGELMDISWSFSWNEQRKRLYSVGTNITEVIEEKISASLQQINEQEAEKQQLFAELHDNICQTLAAAKIFMGNYMNYGGEENLQRSMDLLTQGIDATRALAAVHIYPDLEHQSFQQAVAYFFSQINKTHPVVFHSTIAGRWGEDIPLEVKIMLYRIIQELTYNILHYSKATEAAFSISREKDHIQLIAADNGIGIDFEVAGSQQYFARMRSRIDVLGGSFEVQSKPEQGFRVIMEFDMRRAGTVNATRVSVQEN